MTNNTELIILDTDIGSDIDDALALAYLLSQPACELAGATTVSGEPDKRAQIVHALCLDAGQRQIPIHAGSPIPLLAPVRQPAAPHAAALDPQHAGSFAGPPTAIDFLRRAIRANPGRITLLPIGPLTNIALLFRLDPEIPSLLKRIVLMGGHFMPPAVGRHGTGEWNIFCDPHAAAIVFSADVDILAVGLDVTTQCVIAAAECEERLSSPGIPKLILPMAQIWLQRAPQVTFHDPLAAAVIFKPDLCTYECGTVTVEIKNEETAGTTYWTPDEAGRHRIAVSVDPAAFFAHYFDTLEAGRR